MTTKTCKNKFCRLLKKQRHELLWRNTGTRYVRNLIQFEPVCRPATTGLKSLFKSPGAPLNTSLSTSK